MGYLRNIAAACGHYIGHISLVYIVVATAACGLVDPDSDNSELNWGHMNLITTMNTVRPNETVGICGDVQDETIAAIKQWAEPIKRAPFLKFSKNCNGSGKKVYVQGMPLSQISRKYAGLVAGRVVGVTVPIAGGSAKIEFANDTSHAMATLLHEVGHLWGLCDQYYNKFNPDCDSRYRSARPTDNSIMSNKMLMALTEDDVTSISNVAKRRDLPVNAQWASFLQSANISSNSGTSTSANKDLFLALENAEAQSTLHISSGTANVVAVAICTNRTIAECRNNLSQATLLNTAYASRENRKFYKTADRVALENGTTITMLGLGQSNQILSEVSVRVESAN